MGVGVRAGIGTGVGVGVGVGMGGDVRRDVRVGMGIGAGRGEGAALKISSVSLLSGGLGLSVCIGEPASFSVQPTSQ